MNLIKGYSVKPLINCSILPCIIYLLGDEAFYQLSCRRRRSGTTTRSAISIPTPLRHVDRCWCSHLICLMLRLKNYIWRCRLFRSSCLPFQNWTYNKIHVRSKRWSVWTRGGWGQGAIRLVISIHMLSMTETFIFTFSTHLSRQCKISPSFSSKHCSWLAAHN